MTRLEQNLPRHGLSKGFSLSSFSQHHLLLNMPSSSHFAIKNSPNTFIYFSVSSKNGV